MTAATKTADNSALGRQGRAARSSLPQRLDAFLVAGGA
jgi:hypothetical protein